MPLILLSGFPSSGKTHRSKQLHDCLVEKIAKSRDPKIQRLNVLHIDDQSLGLSRDVYSSARPEKDARATFSSAIKRALSRDTIVIADGMNYIKGFRYQLYCEAKAVRTPHCVVHVGTPAETCRELNDRALGEGSGGYEKDLFENLVFRFEEPNGMNRWDSPLFTILHDDQQPPCEAIWDAMVGADGKVKVVKPNAATVLKPASEQGYLYELDRATSDVLSAISTWHELHPAEAGGQLSIPGSDKPLELPVSVPSQPQLQRLRRQFIGLNRTHTLEKARITHVFVDYLNDQFEA